MRWNVSEAKTRFSELLRMSRDEAQVIESRGRAVAVLLSVDRYQELEAARRAVSPSMRALFEELDRFRADESDPLVEPRADRPMVDLEER